MALSNSDKIADLYYITLFRQPAILRLFKLSNAIDFLHIRFEHLKPTSVTPGLSNPCKQ